MTTRMLKTMVQAAAVTGALAGLPAAATPIVMDLGPGAVPALETSAELDQIQTGGWVINLDTDPNGPFELLHNGEAGFWEKTLSYDGVVPNAALFLSETFTVASGADPDTGDPIAQVWSDWHEEIVLDLSSNGDAYWAWDDTPNAFTATVNGNDVLDSYSIVGNVVNLYFLPMLQSGDTVTITKWLACVPNDPQEVPGFCTNSGSLTVRQWPTVPPSVPEPLTSALLGLGMVGLGLSRRRRTA